MCCLLCGAVNCSLGVVRGCVVVVACFFVVGVADACCLIVVVWRRCGWLPFVVVCCCVGVCWLLRC